MDGLRLFVSLLPEQSLLGSEDLICFNGQLGSPTPQLFYGSFSVLLLRCGSQSMLLLQQSCAASNHQTPKPSGFHTQEQRQEVARSYFTVIDFDAWIGSILPTAGFGYVRKKISDLHCFYALLLAISDQ